MNKPATPAPPNAYASPHHKILNYMKPRESYRIVITPLITLSALFSGCVSSIDPKFQPKQLPIIGDDQGTYFDKEGKEVRWFNEETHRFVELNIRASMANSSATDRREFIKAGLNVSDQIANQWFRVQFAQDIQSRYNNNTFNVITGGITSIFGITDTSAKAVALLGAATSVTNAQWKNYEASYLLSSALPLVLEKLREFRKERRHEIIERYSGEDTPGYPETIDELRNYHQTASREVIKRFIEKSAELAEFTTKFDQQGEVNGIRVLPLNNALFSLLYPKATGTFTKNDLTTIYALTSQAKSSNIVVALEASPSGKHFSEIIEDASKTPDGKAELMKLMSGLNGLLGLDEKVRKQREAVDAAAKAAEAEKTAKSGEKTTTSAEQITESASELEKITAARQMAEAKAKIEDTKTVNLANALDLAKSEASAKRDALARIAAEASNALELLAKKNEQLKEAKNAAILARQAAASIAPEAEAARKAAAEAKDIAIRSKADADSAWEWTGGKDKKLSLARDLAEAAKKLDLVEQAKAQDLAKAADLVRTAETAERELILAVAAAEKKAADLKIQVVSRTSDAKATEDSVKAAEIAASAAERNANTARLAAEIAKATEEQKKALISKQIAAKAEPLLLALEKQLDTPVSSQPRVQSVK